MVVQVRFGGIDTITIIEAGTGSMVAGSFHSLVLSIFLDLHSTQLVWTPLASEREA